MHAALVIAAIALGGGVGFRLGRPSNGMGSTRERWIPAALGGVIAGVAMALLPGMAGNLPETEWPETMVHLETDGAFRAFVEEDGTTPTLISFHAPWCGPCRATAPALVQLAEEGHRVALVDIDAAPTLAERYAIFATPTFLLFENGEPVRSAVGAHTLDELRALMR